MFQKKSIWYFSLLLLPMLIISALINFLYSMNSQDYTQINWFVVIFLAIVLDVLMTWWDSRKKEEKKSE
jgi:hypothetical protein